jgi:hypothetical protein
MAQIYEEVIVIKLSTLTKSNVIVNRTPLATEEVISSIEQVVQELVDDSVVVEVETA